MYGFDSDVLVPMMIFAIPIVAIAGGITAGIVRALGQQRMIEMAQRERIAAIERGVDPAKLPPLPTYSDNEGAVVLTPRQATLRRARGLMVGGLVTLGVGAGLAMMLWIIPSAHEENAWAVGLVPACIGVALILSSLLVGRWADQDEHHPVPRA